MSDQPEYDPGDAVVEEIGEITLADGRKVMGAVLTFPAGPPDLTAGVIWGRVPMTLAVKHKKPAAPAA